MNSTNTTNLICQHFGICGGCQYQDVEYSVQLENKYKLLVEQFKDFDVDKITPVIPSPKIWYYRNKMEFIIGKDKTGKIVAGLRQKNKFYKIVDLKECRISFEQTGDILDNVKKWVSENHIETYDLLKHSGKVRYLTVKQAKSTTETMLILVVTGTKYQIEHNEYQLFNNFVTYYKNMPEVSSVYIAINNKISDNAVPDDVLLFYGKNSILDTINDVKYEILPTIFLQTNPKCCDLLYKTVLDEIVEGNILDLYCGSGGITLQVAKHKPLGKIIGIDSSKDNIAAAQNNLLLNNLSENIEFVCDNVEVFITKLWKSKFMSNLSNIIVDPPRPGLSKKVKGAISDLAVNKIIYISCNPNTLYEDLKTFVKFYRIKKIIPIDMFPHTQHIELVCVLEHK
ncbi:MAG: 23S rRNA (uracil(1939)-C(5))-methyltransferase RlmD [Endomicrobia bacterium]|nr:23S rRNA (uracil(1939)-C(5))-methyltransferase RlmD [Endomicrobiia bacterium]